MRISLNKGDPGHREYLRRGGDRMDWTVTLNGEPVTDVITADEEQGFVVRLARDAEDKPIEAKAGGVAETESLGGVVAISCRKRVG